MSVTAKVRLDTLTPRQLESLALVAKGLTNAEIGEKLGVEECTIFTAISYEGDIVEKFNAEAVALKSWRSKVWVRANSILEEFEAGSIDRPTLEEFVAMLPAYEG